MATSGYSTGYTVPYTGNQALRRHQEIVRKEKYIVKMHELREKPKPPLYDATPEELDMARGVYGVRMRPRPKALRVFDRIHKMPPDWDQKVKHDAYRNLQQYKINCRVDEDNRQIPIMTNSEMGHRLKARPEQFRRDHARVKVFHNSVYRTNGVNIGN